MQQIADDEETTSSDHHLGDSTHQFDEAVIDALTKLAMLDATPQEYAAKRSHDASQCLEKAISQQLSTLATEEARSVAGGSRTNTWTHGRVNQSIPMPAPPRPHQIKVNGETKDIHVADEALDSCKGRNEGLRRNPLKFLSPTHRGPKMRASKLACEVQNGNHELDEAVLDVLTKRVKLEAKQHKSERENHPVSHTKSKRLRTKTKMAHPRKGAIEQVCDAYEDHPLDEAVLEVLSKRDTLEAKECESEIEADVSESLEYALAHGKEQKAASQQLVQGTSLQSDPRLQSPENLTQLQPTVLRRVPNVRQQIQQPGAYMAAPGRSLQRIDNLMPSHLHASGPATTGHGIIAGSQDQAMEETITSPRSSKVDARLLVAEAVMGESAIDILQEAEEVDMTGMSERHFDKEAQRQLCHRLGCCLIFSSLLFLTITLGVVFSTRESVTIAIDPTVSPSIAPTYVPSSAPSGQLDLLYDGLPPYTKESLQNFSTPQWAAWEWLLNHRNITKLPEWRKRQLFALGTFYYAFKGEHWPEIIRNKWMDDTVSECFWFSSKFGEIREGEGRFAPYLSSWNSYLDPCNQLQEFQSLILDDLQLVGMEPSIPPEIEMLTSLSFLEFSINNISMALFDMLHPVLYEMKNLTGIELGVNSFSGLLPSELALLTGMTYLSTEWNLLSGAIPSEFGKLSNLTSVNLGHNSLTGLLPTELGFMTSMTDLNFYQNSLLGSLPSEIGKMTNLIILYTFDNLLSGSICSELGQLTSLEVLDLSSNSFFGALPSELGQLTKLEYLFLSNLAFVTGSLPSELALLTSLAYLDISGSGLSGTIPAELCRFRDESCNFDSLGSTRGLNCTFYFDCSDVLCGCDCPCFNST